MLIVRGRWLAIRLPVGLELLPPMVCQRYNEMVLDRWNMFRKLNDSGGVPGFLMLSLDSRNIKTKFVQLIQDTAMFAS